jgi:hypothetical protein
MPLTNNSVTRHIDAQGTEIIMDRPMKTKRKKSARRKR